MTEIKITETTNEKDEYLKKLIEFHTTSINDELLFEGVRLWYIDKKQFDKWLEIRDMLVIDNYKEKEYLENKNIEKWV